MNVLIFKPSPFRIFYSQDKFLGSIFIISAYGARTYVVDFAFSR